MQLQQEGFERGLIAMTAANSDTICIKMYLIGCQGRELFEYLFPGGPVAVATVIKSLIDLIRHPVKPMAQRGGFQMREQGLIPGRNKRGQGGHWAMIT
jgi:hypothetical protein